MAKVYFRKDAQIYIPEAAYEYARRLEKYEESKKTEKKQSN